ncbi:MAG: beta-ketoacyl synthase N-terminal-like domain-containing protein, partial [Verrucomicrobiota bacterium]
DFGFDSISLAEFARRLTRHLGFDITPSVFFGHSTLEKLTGYLVEEHGEAMTLSYAEPVEAVVSEPEPVAPPVTPGVPEPMAVIGMSGRFPGAETVDEFWGNFKEGRNGISEAPADRWDWRASGESSRGGGFMKDVDRFDPLFFEMAPRDAAGMDPKQRLFLEEAWRTFEDAGYMGESIAGLSCGVYVGVEESEYGLLAGESGQVNGNQNATLAARISYTLDLRGPNLALTTACSSALVALHQACLALRQGDCELALVGGVSLMLSPALHVGLQASGMLSPDGQCRVFDRRANGLVPGEAVAAVLLKPLSKAMADHDHIYGAVKATGVNYDGRTNGITAPNPVSQADLMKSVYERYAIDPDDVQYVMAHSFGSPICDPVEIDAYRDAWRGHTDRTEFCALGSVKPLIGHTFAASGVVNLIAMLKAMGDRVIPGWAEHETNKAYIRLDRTPFVLNDESSAWTSEVDRPRLGVIGGAGISGTNAHVVVEEVVSSESADETFDAPEVVILSARNGDRLQAVMDRLLGWIETHPEARLSDLAYTLQVGRESMKERIALVVDSLADLGRKLKNPNAPGVVRGTVREADRKRDREGIVQQALDEEDLEQLAQAWVDGYAVPWKAWSREGTARRIPLPTYPFARRRCWVDEQAESGPEPERVYTNKAEELYTFVADKSDTGFREEFLTFCPFPEKVPGFSMSRLFAVPIEEVDPAHIALIREKQLELRQVLFCREDFGRIQTLLDFGCGHGTDVIKTADTYPHLRTHGYTITAAQADLGNERIRQMNLGGRSKIFNRDSSKDPFPDRYDLVIGVEVSCHIEDKEGLFGNISSSLQPGGRVLLMDFIANLQGSIVDPNVDIYISTREEWVDILSRHQLVIDELIDVSTQIANFQHDPDHDEITRDLPEVVRASLRNYANNAIALERGWINYCLFKIAR